MLLGGSSVLVFALGLIAAAYRLPEWRSGEIPRPSFFSERLTGLARQAGVAIEGEPRFGLQSTRWLNNELQLIHSDPAYETLGPSASDWLTREGRGPFVNAGAQGRWTGGAGELRVLFSLRGEPVAAMWTPRDPFARTPKSESEAMLRFQAIMAIAAHGQSMERSEQTSILGQRTQVAGLPSSRPPESLIGVSFLSTDVAVVHRITNSAEQARKHLAAISVGGIIARVMPKFAINLLVFILFIVLLVRRRLDLRSGAVLALVSFSLSMISVVRDSETWIQLVNPMSSALGKAVGLGILWSAAESWVRSTVPGFRSSLDDLRARRLGPNAARALLAGSAIGTALVGIQLAILSLSTLVRGVSPIEGSVVLPVFSAQGSPLEEVAIRTSIILLGVCAGMRLPIVRRIPGADVLLTGLMLAPHIPLSSVPIAIAAGLIIGAVLVRAHKEFGLTALLVAATLSITLPVAIMGLRHFGWMQLPAIIMGGVSIAPLALGLIGIRRPEEVERGPVRMPAFVRRLEEENRLKHELDLLARIQLGLLPTEMPRLDGFEIAARSVLAHEAGGDLYDFISDGDGRIWIAAGDVSGHGYSCAIAHAMTKAGLASLIEADRAPAEVLDRLHRVLRGIGAQRTFTSLVLLRLDTAAAEAVVSNAGHPYPLVASAAGVREIDMPSLPLGQGPERIYRDVAIPLSPGTMVVLASDGLFESPDANGKPYGFDRLRERLADLARHSADRALDEIFADWRTHVGTLAPPDDTTVVVLKMVQTQASATEDTVSEDSTR